MKYVDELIEWNVRRGVTARGFDDVEAVVGVPAGLPEELAAWFELRMPHRVYASETFCFWGMEGYLLWPELDQDLSWAIYPEEFDDVCRLGKFPEAPVGFALFGGEEAWVVETAGERRGWVYATDIFDPGLGGPLAVSISELLRALRRLAEVGVLLEVDDETIPELAPPVDTPRALIGPTGDVGPIGRHGTGFEGEPIARSIRDLLPDFEFLMPLVPVEELE